MKLLHTTGAIISLAFLAIGITQLYRLGLRDGGVQSLCAAAASGFALSLTLYVFDMRRRIKAVEQATGRQEKGQEPGE